MTEPTQATETDPEIETLRALDIRDADNQRVNVTIELEFTPDHSGIAPSLPPNPQSTSVPWGEFQTRVLWGAERARVNAGAAVLRFDHGGEKEPVALLQSTGVSYALASSGPEARRRYLIIPTRSATPEVVAKHLGMTREAIVTADWLWVANLRHFERFPGRLIDVASRKPRVEPTPVTPEDRAAAVESARRYLAATSEAASWDAQSAEHAVLTLAARRHEQRLADKEAFDRLKKLAPLAPRPKVPERPTALTTDDRHIFDGVEWIEVSS